MNCPDTQHGAMAILLAAVNQSHNDINYKETSGVLQAMYGTMGDYMPVHRDKKIKLHNNQDLFP